MSENVHVCQGVTKDCINLDSYGEICVGCNACGKFNKETMWQARHNMYWWRVADELDKYHREGYRSKIQQENIAKNLIWLGERILECVQNMDIEKAEIKPARTFDYIFLVNDIKNNAVRDLCEICKMNERKPDCQGDCCECNLDCACRECRECSNWKWRGEE